MRSTYRVLAMLVAVGVVLQAAFIAFAWFTVTNDTDSGVSFTGEDDLNVGHELHSFGWVVIVTLCLALLIVSFFAKIRGGVKWAAIVFGVAVLQVVLGITAYSLPAVGLLHGINAFALAGAASLAAKQATTASTAAAPQRTRSPA